MICYIMRGISGSGKSTMATRIASIIDDEPVTVSADNFFLDDYGVYNFDASKLGQAHDACFSAFKLALIRGHNVIVDNTNTTLRECERYYSEALRYGYEIHVVTVLTDPEVAAARNSHGVPAHTVMNMFHKLMDSTQIIRQTLSHASHYTISSATGSIRDVE